MVNDLEQRDTDLERWLRADARRRYGEPPMATATWTRLAPRLERRWAWPQHRRWHPFALAPLGTALLVLIALGMALRPASPASASAAQILARATRVADDPGAYGVRGYQGIITSQSRQARDSYQTSTYDPASAPLVTGEMSLWFRAPGSWRMESPYSLTVTDGADCWRTDEVRRRAARVDPSWCDPAGLLNPADLPALMSGAGGEYEARLGADTAVVGRSAYTLVITLAAVPVPAADAPPVVAYPRTATDQIRRTVWVDRQTYLVLGVEDRDPLGTLLTGWVYASLVLDPPLDPALFTYTPPDGFAIIDERGRATPTPRR